jgi:hypothetical protein
VEASLRLAPPKGAVMELLIESPGAVCRRLRALQVELTAAELEDQLMDAGLALHGSPAGRARAAAPTLTRIAADVARALSEGRPVLVVHTDPGPTLGTPGGAVELAEARAAGLGGPGRLLNVGDPGRAAELVAAGLVAWCRAQRKAPEALMVVTGGQADLEPARDWQPSLQRLADTLDLPLTVRHLPAGVSRWLPSLGAVFGVDAIAPGGATFRTTVHRLYARRPPRLPAPLTVDARGLGAARGGTGGVKAEGTPARRIYRVRPQGRR